MKAEVWEYDRTIRIELSAEQTRVIEARMTLDEFAKMIERLANEAYWREVDRLVFGGRKMGEPKWRRRKDERPGELISAARIEFATHGAKATLAQIAKRAGVSKGTIFLYFESKADLFLQATGAPINDRAQAEL